MFYIGITISICVGVYLGLSFSKDSKATWKMLKTIGEIILSWAIFLGQILLCLAILGGIIYLFYRLFKAIDWDVVGIILLWLVLVFGFIFVVSRLYKITHKK